MKYVRTILIGIQMFIVVFPAISVIAILSGWDIGILLFSAGISTLIFYFFNRKKVPMFLGPSFVLTSMVVVFSNTYSNEYVLGGIIAVGVVYLIFALLIKFIGIRLILKLFSPVITGTIIIIIGTHLLPIGTKYAGNNWFIALFSLFVIIFTYFILPPKYKVFSLFLGILSGYLLSIPFGLVDYSNFHSKASFALPHFMLPKFNLTIIISMLVVGFALMLEHIGDIFAISSIARKNFFIKPGLHKTLAGNGIVTIISGIIGSIGLTTYSEGSGAYVINNDYNPVYMVIAALIAILLSFSPGFTSFFMIIPQPVIGAMMILMFGLISSIGIRILIVNEVNLMNFKNLIIIALMLGFGLGGVEFSTGYFKLTGVAIAGISGIILNLIIPEEKK